MTGGAIAPFAWALILATFGVINWIWTGDAIQMGTFGFAVATVIALSAGLVLRSREAARRGSPPARAEVQTIPSASLGAVLAAIGIASIVFGLAFGKFPIYFGTGLLVAALGRLVLEVRSERRTRALFRGEEEMR
jgi:hypothetical protein